VEPSGSAPGGPRALYCRWVPGRRGADLPGGSGAVSYTATTIIVREGPGPMVGARFAAILRQQEARKTVILDMSVLIEGPQSEQK
jgi:hypothetical protein